MPGTKCAEKATRVRHVLQRAAAQVRGVRGQGRVLRDPAGAHAGTGTRAGPGPGGFQVASDPGP
eukprot:223822-Rhodomonas_salina.1